MELDGPPRMVGWITWSGRERSSQTQFLPVPGAWLIHPLPIKNCDSEDLQNPAHSPNHPNNQQNQNSSRIQRDSE